MPNNKLDVRAYPIDEPKGNTRAFASVAVDDIIAIRGIRVVDGEKGMFMSMPQSKDKDGEYHDIAFPLNGDLRKEMEAAVIDEYVNAANLPPDQRGYGAPDMSAANGKRLEDVMLDVRVYPLPDPQGSTMAFASVSLNETIAIRGVRVVDGEKGLFVTMPQSKDKDGEYHDIAFPLNGDIRKEISRAVLEKYENGERPKDKSLADGLRKGAEKAAEQASAPREAAKSRHAGALE